MNDVVTAILGGGRGTRLWPLTRTRAKPAVPVGGKFRLIDIPISNSLHAGVDRIYVLTQFSSAGRGGPRPRRHAPRPLGADRRVRRDRARSPLKHDAKGWIKAGWIANG